MSDSGTASKMTLHEITSEFGTDLKMVLHEIMSEFGTDSKWLCTKSCRNWVSPVRRSGQNSLDIVHMAMSGKIWYDKIIQNKCLLSVGRDPGGCCQNPHERRPHDRKNPSEKKTEKAKKRSFFPLFGMVY